MFEKICKLMIALFLVAGICHATSVTFTSSGTIQNGEVYNYVYVENDGTVVDMTGGQIGNLQTSYISTFNLYGGQIAEVAAGDTGPTITIGPLGTINILNGLVDIKDFVIQGIGYISGGDISSDRLKTYPGTAVDISGGILDLGLVDIHSDFSISGGSFYASDSYVDYSGPGIATINVYGYGFSYDPDGGILGGGILTGYLLDNNAFTFDGLNELEYSRFNLIPEPTTLLLLGLGGLFLRKRS